MADFFASPIEMPETVKWYLQCFEGKNVHHRALSMLQYGSNLSGTKEDKRQQHS